MNSRVIIYIQGQTRETEREDIKEVTTMTNQKAAIIRGIERYSHRAYEYENAIKAAGMEIIATEVKVINLTCIEAKRETSRGTLHIYCGENGTARIDKPNGSHKWVYEKTPAQIAAQIKQIVEFYR